MKTYTVYYIVKANRNEYLFSMDVQAANAKEAKSEAKRIEHERSGRNAFRPTLGMDSLGYHWERVAARKGITVDAIRDAAEGGFAIF